MAFTHQKTFYDSCHMKKPGHQNFQSVSLHREIDQDSSAKDMERYQGIWGYGTTSNAGRTLQSSTQA